MMNELLKDFFLGNEVAWEDISRKVRQQLIPVIERQFLNVPAHLIQEKIVEWMVDFYLKVKKAQTSAQEIIKKLACNKTEADTLKIEYCEEATRFKFSPDGNFENWLFRSFLNCAIDVRRKTLNEWKKHIEIDGQPFEIPDNKPSIIIDSPNNLKAQFPFLYQVVASSLDEIELFYFGIWLKHGADPPITAVIDEFLTNYGEKIDSSDVTHIKQKFLIKSYLGLLRAEYEANSMSNLFRRFIESENIQKLFPVFMLENIWQSFIADEPTVVIAKRAFPHWRWRDLLEDAKKSLNKIEIRTSILVEVYDYFRNSSPQPEFYYLIEIYADNRFGRKIRELFKPVNRYD